MRTQSSTEIVAARHRWTVPAFHKMLATGLLGEDDRVELIEGELFDIAPVGSDHGGRVKRLNHVFSTAAANRAIVSIQDPVVLNDYSEPQPDIALLRWRDDFYSNSHPRRDDILLIVEVADTSACYDREVKIPLYARSGIVEVWLLDLQRSRLEIYRKPRDGEYTHIEQRRAGSISPAQFPQVVIELTDLLGRL